MSTTATTRAEQFTGIGDLRLKNEHGDVTIRCTRSDGTATVRLTAHGQVELEPATVRAEGGTLVVDVPGLLDTDGGRGFSFQLGPISLSSGSTRVDIEVDLPHEAGVTARTKSGDITLSGECGDLSAKSGSGDVTFEHARQIHTATGSGDISGRTCRGGSATTGSGDISLDEVTGTELQCKAGSGDISLRRTHLERTSAATGSGGISVALGGGSLEAKSGSGSIDIAVPQGIPVWLDLASGTGRVTKDIEPVGAPAEGQAHLSVKAKSGVGSIRVHH